MEYRALRLHKTSSSSSQASSGDKLRHESDADVSKLQVKGFGRLAPCDGSSPKEGSSTSLKRPT